jgi:two-component system osmolarity sensor histidine kinase EnvZ
VQLIAGAEPLPRSMQARLDFRRATQPPAVAREPRLPFQRHIAVRLQSYFGSGTPVLFTGRPDARVWVRTDAANKDGPWIGVRVPDLVEQTVGATARLLLFGLFASVVLAYWFARNLTEPLQRLAAQAPALSRGQFPESPPSGQGPREIVALESALRTAALEIQQSARDREMLLAGVSHDLRTPLARLRLALELQTGIPRDERDALHADLEEMDAIINQFLDYVRDGRDESMQKLDLAELIDSAIADSARAGYAWRREGPDSLIGDCRPLSLRRALRNLMHNAELHGQSPYVLALAKEGNEIRVVITDAGPGVPPDWLPNAGKPFSRADEARGGKPGAGLGLSLASRVMQMHDGRLTLANLPAGGFKAALVWRSGA